MLVACTYTFDFPYEIYPPTELSVWVQVEETCPNQQNQTSSTTNWNNDTALKPPSSIAINNNSTSSITTANNNLTTHPSSLTKTSDNITIKPVPSTVSISSSGSLSSHATINNFSLQLLPAPRDIIRLLILTLSKGAKMKYMKHDISAENKFFLFDFQTLLEEMKESMEKYYQTLENTNTESLKSKLITSIQTGKDIEKEISELVGQCCDNGDSLEDILDDNYAEFGKTIMD